MILRRQVSAVGIALTMLLGGAAGALAMPSSVSAAAPDPVQPLDPVRLADTRPGQSTVDGQFTGMPRPAAGSITEITIAGRGGVALNATAALINLTAVQPSGNTFLTAYPCGTDRPNVSNLNSPPQDIRANSAFVKLSATGTVCIYTVAATDFIIDVSGYVPTAGSPVSLNPARLFDSRPGEKTIDGQHVGIGRRPPGSITEVPIAGRAGVPTDATAVVINLTSVLPSVGNFLTVFPCGTITPNASNINSPANDIRANNAFVKLSTTGKVCVYTVNETDFIIDVNGYVPTSGSPSSVEPARLFDSRPGEKTIDGKYAGPGRVAAGSSTEVQIAGRGGVPANATAAVINLTSVFPAAGNFLTVFPCGANRPNVSNLNSPPNDIRANNAFVKLSPTGTLCVYTVAATDFIVDINGYVTPALGPPPTLCTINGSQVTSQLPGSECQALTALYNSTGGPNWKTRTNWMTNTDPCTWYGIKCTAGHVSELVLIANGLTGTIPPEIGNLTGLKILTLTQSNLSGPIPADIGRLTNLNFLTLSSSKLNGVPAEISKLTNLNGLSLEGNEITSIPTELGALTNLVTLSLAGNQLTTVPPSIGNLAKLGILNLDLNQLTRLPTEIGNLRSIQILSVGKNQLTSLPATIGNLGCPVGQSSPDCVPLVSLDFSFNKLTSVPTELGNIRGGGPTNVLALDNNLLTTLPPSIGNLSRVSVLNLAHNKLNSVPAEIGKLTQLGTLTLDHNGLTAAPAGIEKLINLTSVSVDHNQLAGDLTPVFTPLMNANKIGLNGLTLNNNLCLYTTSPALAAWFTARDKNWKNVGCP